MSAIDELKNGAEQSSGKTINITTGHRKPITINRAAAEKSTVDDRNAINETDSPKSYTEAILDTENPNSDFMKHVREKEEEAREWIAEQEEKKRLAEEEKALVEEDEEDDDMDDVNSIPMPEEEDLDNPVMTSESVDESDVIEFDDPNFIDATGGMEVNEDKEDTPEKDEEEFGEVIDITGESSDNEEDTEDIAQPEEKKEEEPQKKVQYSAPEINIEVSQETESTLNEEEDSEEDEDVQILNDEEENDDDDMERLRQITTERLKPASLNLDLSSFTIAKKAKVNANDVFKAYKAKISKWVLFNQKCTVLMKEFSGSELEMLMEYYNASRRSVDALRRVFHMIYDHIASAKPANFETWMKVTPYSDLDNYFFAIHIASFNGANYIPVDCSNESCGKSYVTDNIDIMDSMVKFDSEDDKAEFSRIYKSEVPLSSSGIYTSEVIPLSNKVAIGFKEPSLFDSIEIGSIDDKTQQEYASMITLIPYIDNIYEIDLESKTLTPIDYKKYPENMARTTRSRIKKYNNIFASLTVDEFSPVKAYVSRLATRSNSGINYVIPETTCPECGHLNPEIKISQGQVADMVFTRCQLGALVSTSIK